MQDKTLACLECGNEFIFSADEQEFYSDQGFEEPKRCRPCSAQMHGRSLCLIRQPMKPIAKALF